MGEISYAEYLVSPKYRKFPFGGIIGWILANRPLSVDDLQNKYSFAYYSTMNLAVNDVNNGTTANADSTKDSAVAGVYTDENGGKNVVLLKDHTEAARITATTDMTINLGGNILSSENKIAIAITSGNVTIDGRLAGSTILNRQNGDIRASAVAAAESTKLFINGGQYACYGENLPDNTGAIVTTGSLTVQDARIIIECTIGHSHGITLGHTSTAVISNTEIIATSTDGCSFGVDLNSDSIATLTDCNIKAYSNYLYSEETHCAAFSKGIRNFGTLTLNDCYVMGTHSGISGNGILYVDGGTYEGYGHGGFYFAASDTTSYVRDAVIRDCDMPDGYTATASRNGAGFYMNPNGYNDQTSGTQIVYMDNCDIYGISASQIIAMAGGDKNELYISNSTINNMKGGDANIRIDVGNNKLYIGAGNNFTAEDTSLPEAVVVTDEVYVQGGGVNG